MTRSELVAALAERAGVPQTFECTHRAAREGRNPATGKTMTIPAGYSVKVAAGSKLKEAAKGK
ncbi:HU family DNA-binding protein [Streptomyces sp. NPDC057889]|uniref:HU family DNA-binding protein n=1 Tax=unclassified Streptomyces TaxID=2593676 RepID=UPI0036A38CA1